MDALRYERLAELFARARRLEPEQRRALLDVECSDDAGLRAEVESLLGHQESAARLLGTTGASGESLLTTRDDEQGQLAASMRVGPYRIVQRIGEGGMGEVYQAEQEKPIRRKVALKVTKWGMDSKQVVARFESERQALAMMDHPGIARVFDAGTTPNGRPYFVMEFVRGEPITEYCDRHRLSLDERLGLFCRVCDAVQHAHHKGVIHRDIKPSNVLVAVQDEGPFPKIIDFGVAKATQQRLTEMTPHTALGQLVGTPAYMSPEQVEMTTLDVDTRTDVYSLGVLLYELLVGVLPFSAEDLLRVSFDEMRRVIREDNPPRPSARISELGEAIAETRHKRRAAPGELVRVLQGDLDWITMRALEKDRTRRYGSPAELAADIRRYLKHEPVLARPPSTAYRVSKFVRRHRVGTLASAAVLLAIVAGAVLATVGFFRARQAELEARRAETEAREVADFMVGVFEVADPSESRGNEVTARELLDRASERIDRGLAGDALTRARLQHTMGRVYISLGLYGPAGALLESSLRIREERLGAKHPSVIESLNTLGILRRSTGQFDQAEAYGRRALSIAEETLGPDHLDTAWSRYYLAWTVGQSGDAAEAERLVRSALPVFERELGPDDLAVAWCVNDLGSFLALRGDFRTALPLFERALEIKQEVLGSDHRDVAEALFNLADAHSHTGEHRRARDYCERGLKMLEATLEQDHPQIGANLSRYALVLARAAAFEEAESAYRRAMEILEASWGPEHPLLLYQQSCYLALTGRRAEALDRLRRAIAGGVGGALVLNDLDLASLQGDPEFEELVAPLRPPFDPP